MPHSKDHRAGYPAVTRREAHALAQAREALWAITCRSRSRAYSNDRDEAFLGAVLMERADVARDAVAAFLIAAHVHAESSQAHAALEQS